MNEIIAVIIDAATGYRLVVRRVDTEVERFGVGTAIEYEVDLHAPRPKAQSSLSEHFDGNLIDSVTTVPVRSDGTGFIPSIPTPRS